MELTTEQRSAISNQLSVSLSGVDDDKLIELCVLHSSAPDVREEFETALGVEVVRRFTPAKIAIDIANFSAVMSFINKFKIEPLFSEAQKSSIATQLEAVLLDVDDDKLVELCLLYIKAGEPSLDFEERVKTEILRRFTSVAINSDPLPFAIISLLEKQFNAMPLFRATMLDIVSEPNKNQFITTHNTLITTSLSDKADADWLMSQSDVLSALLSVSNGVRVVAESQTASESLFESLPARTIFKGIPEIYTQWSNYDIGMIEFAKSSAALKDFIKKPDIYFAGGFLEKIAARTEEGEEDALQKFRQQLYNTVSASWTKSWSGKGTGAALGGQIDANVTTPEGFVFAAIGVTSAGVSGSTTLMYTDTYAGCISSKVYTTLTNLSSVDAVGVQYSKFTGVSSSIAFVEYWTPPA